MHKNQHFLDKEFTGLVFWVNLGLPFEGFSEHVPNFVAKICVPKYN